MHVRRRTTPASAARRLLLACCLLGVVLASTRKSAEAKTTTESYIFVLSRVKLPKDAPAELEALLRKQLDAVIAQESSLRDAIPEDAPTYDPKKKGRYGNKPFHKYMKERNLRPFHVTIQVTKYESTLEPNPKKPGQILGSTIVLRLFGETIPDRVMAFTGDGSATVLAEIGKKVRDRDREWADSDAVELAISRAVSMSLDKLKTKPTKPQPKKRKRRKKP